MKAKLELHCELKGFYLTKMDQHGGKNRPSSNNE